jgi:hypothetical protein
LVSFVNKTVTNNTAKSSSLVALWHFDEYSGTKVGDSSGNGNNGTIHGQAVWMWDGLLGKALKFDGSSNCVEVPYNSVLNPRKALTVEAWIMPTCVKKRGILAKSLGANTDYKLPRDDKKNVGVTVKIGGVAKTVLSAQNSVPLGSWTYVAATYDGASLKLYINGKLVGSVKASGDISAHNQILRMGGDSKEANYKGFLDEVSIYSTALTADEILSHCKALKK